jgi:hypothetical protein
MIGSSIRGLVLVVVAAAATAPACAQSQTVGANQPGARPQRKVLVELFTSQGCDYCPDAERMLGALAAETPGIVPVALHVDYFNDPWVDPFSNRLFSQRQAAYNGLFRGPKNPEYGIYYTPMLMIDGKDSVGGRDRAAALTAIRRALVREPAVTLEAKLEVKDQGRSGTLNMTLSPRSSRVVGAKLLVGALVREHPVKTFVASGENARKTLTNRYPARAFLYQYVVLERGKKRTDLTFPIRIEPDWTGDQLDVVAFAQDNSTGVVHQVESLPWRAAALDPRRDAPDPRRGAAGY